jgi:hypothetical protein
MRPTGNLPVHAIETVERGDEDAGVAPSFPDGRFAA